MKKETVKSFLITSIPSLILIFRIGLFYILKMCGVKVSFYMSLIDLFIMSAHPYYLVVVETKTNRGEFLKGFFDICVLLLPYLPLIRLCDELSIGLVIALAEYGITIFLWFMVCVVVFVKKKKVKNGLDEDAKTEAKPE